MSYTLHYSPGAASMAVHWMLIELGVPFEAKLVSIDAGANRSPEYLSVNPSGRLPALSIDGVAYTESTALLMLLAERHPDKKLAPPPGSAARAHWLEMMIYLANNRASVAADCSQDRPSSPANEAPPPGSAARAHWLEMMIYLANNLLPPMRDWFYAATDGDPSGADAVKALARRRIESGLDRLDAQVADGRAYLLGSQMTTVDLLATMIMRWSRNMPRPATTWKNLAPYVQRMRAMPSFIDMNRREGLTEWQN